MKLLALTAAALALLLAACGDEDEDEPPTTAPGEVATGTTGATGSEEPAIVVERPAPGATVTSPVTVAGTAAVFEGNVTIRIVDANGEELASTFTTASCGGPCRGDFSKDVRFTIAEAGDATIEVSEQDVAPPGEGGEPASVEVPVTLEP